MAILLSFWSLAWSTRLMIPRSLNPRGFAAFLLFSSSLTSLYSLPAKSQETGSLDVTLTPDVIAWGLARPSELHSELNAISKGESEAKCGSSRLRFDLCIDIIAKLIATIGSDMPRFSFHSCIRLYGIDYKTMISVGTMSSELNP